MIDDSTAKPNSAVALQPCPLGHITADKRLRYALPKFPSATSFIRETLYEIRLGRFYKILREMDYES